MPLVAYTKSHLTVSQQISLLQSRGMQISDVVRAEQHLQRVGYYRLSGYWYPFREMNITTKDGKLITEVSDMFRSGTEFQHALALYVFDKKLRLILLDAIERIEIALRVDIAHMLGAYDAWAHRDGRYLHGKFSRPDADGNTWHQKWLRDLNNREKRSKEEFIKRYHDKYTSPLPVWMSIEVWDFGLMSTLLENLKISDQESIAKRYAIPSHKLLVSWVKSINYMRNLCAHHSRLWNCSPVEQPKIPKLGEVPVFDHWANDKVAQARIYPSVCIMQHLLRTINPSSRWKVRLKNHIEQEFPAVGGLNITQAGFPAGWRDIELWS